MNDKEKLDCMFQTRISKSQQDKLNEIGAKPREVVDYFIRHNTNPTLKLKNRQRELLKNIAEWENNITEAREELKEVNLRLGISIDENTASLDVVTIGERLKNNCQIKNKGKCDELTLRNYMNLYEANQILKHGIAEYNIRGEENKENFKKEVFKYLRLD